MWGLHSFGSPPQNYWIRICVVKRSPGDLYPWENLRSNTLRIAVGKGRWCVLIPHNVNLRPGQQCLSHSPAMFNFCHICMCILLLLIQYSSENWLTSIGFRKDYHWEIQILMMSLNFFSVNRSMNLIPQKWGYLYSTQIRPTQRFTGPCPEDIAERWPFISLRLTCNLRVGGGKTLNIDGLIAFISYVKLVKVALTSQGTILRADNIRIISIIV